MIIALFGAPGAGKDTVGKILVEQHAYRRVAFADKVRELALKLYGDKCIDFSPSRIWTLKQSIESHGWEVVKRESPMVRELLERVGDGCREVLGDRVWIYAAFDCLTSDDTNVVITDVRKANEIDWILDWSASVHYPAVVWHITRNGCKKRPFDEWKPGWATATIKNNGTIEELAAKIKELMNGLATTTPSPSQR